MRPYYLINVGLREQCTMWKSWNENWKPKSRWRERNCINFCCCCCYCLGPCLEYGRWRWILFEIMFTMQNHGEYVYLVRGAEDWRMFSRIILVPACYIRNYEQTMTMNFVFIYFLSKSRFTIFLSLCLFIFSIQWLLSVEFLGSSILISFFPTIGVSPQRCQCFLINNNSNILGAWPKQSKLIVGLFSYLLSHTTDSLFWNCVFPTCLQFAVRSLHEERSRKLIKSQCGKIIATLVWVH